jgi:sugar lactone lactonase YvrE
MRPLLHVVVALLVLLALVGIPWRADASALYVADAGAMAVFRYPLLPGGLPQAKPASELDLEFPPASIAFSPSGALYVSATKRGRVNVYAPLAQGHTQPIRVLETGGTPLGIATDPQGYVYVGGVQPICVEIFSPTAHGHAKPVGSVCFSGRRARIQSIAVDFGGRLFALSQAYPEGTNIGEFADPKGSPQLVRVIQPVTPGIPFGIAVDSNHELYVPAFNYWTYKATVSEFDPTTCCQGQPYVVPYVDRIMAPVASPFAPTAVTIDGRHAFVSSVGSGVAPTVFVFDIFDGEQVPLAELSGAPLSDPIAVAVGL